MKTLIITLASLIAGMSFPAQDDRELTIPTGWSWYEGQTAAQIDAKIAQGNRLVEVEVRQTAPARYSAAFVSNSGEYAKSWWYYFGTTTASIGQHLSNNNARLVDLDCYTVGGSGHYLAVMVCVDIGTNVLDVIGSNAMATVVGGYN